MNWEKKLSVDITEEFKYEPPKYCYFKVQKAAKNQYTLENAGVQWFKTAKGEKNPVGELANELIDSGALRQVDATTNVEKFTPIFEEVLANGASEAILTYVQTIGLTGKGKVLGAWDPLFEKAQSGMSGVAEFVPRYRVDTTPIKAQQELTLVPAELLTGWDWFWSWFGYTYYKGSITPKAQKNLPVKNQKIDSTNLASANLHHDWSNPIVPAIWEQFGGQHVHIFNIWLALTDVTSTPLGFVHADPSLDTLKVALATKKDGKAQTWVGVLTDWLNGLHAGQTILFSNMHQGDFLVFDTLKKVHGALPLATKENFRASVEFRVVYVEE